MLHWELVLVVSCENLYLASPLNIYLITDVENKYTIQSWTWLWALINIKCQL